MLSYALIYLALTFGGVVALSVMILRIGALVGNCPKSKAAAKVAAPTVATGFAAIGVGGVILIGAVLPLMRDAPVVALMAGAGLAALCLGLGFVHAMGNLRNIVAQVGNAQEAPKAA